MFQQVDGLTSICRYILNDNTHIEYNCTKCHFPLCPGTTFNTPYCGLCHIPDFIQHNADGDNPFCGECHYCRTTLDDKNMLDLSEYDWIKPRSICQACIQYN